MQRVWTSFLQIFVTHINQFHTFTMQYSNIRFNIIHIRPGLFPWGFQSFGAQDAGSRSAEFSLIVKNQ
jgi:hypothetical protein